MPTTITPNMSLIKPTTLSEPGPDYATDVNSSTDLIDAHDHSTGKGVKVPTAGMNINADLPAASFNIYQLRATKYDNQSGALAQPTDLRMLYVRSGELYYVDNSGNQVKITNGGSVNVSGSNGIGGDYPSGGAAINYTLATLTYEILSNTSGPAYANINVGGINAKAYITAASTAVASSPYTIAANDLVLLVDTTSARTINLPNATTSKRLIIIKDVSGTSQTNNITVDRSAGGNIDGVASNKTLNFNYGTWYFLSDGTNWFLLKNDVQPTTPTSQVIVDTGNGTGSINTRIRRFVNTRLSTGSAITYADSATNGGSFTINTNGVYTIDYTDIRSAGGIAHVGVSLNGSALTTGIDTITYAQGKRSVTNLITNGEPQNTTWTGRLVATDVIRAQTDSATASGEGTNTIFSICQVSLT